MKPYAATIGVKNRICQQVIQVDGTHSRHNETGLPPILFPEQSAQNKRHNQVKSVMDGMPEDLDIDFHKSGNVMRFRRSPPEIGEQI